MIAWTNGDVFFFATVSSEEVVRDSRGFRNSEIAALNAALEGFDEDGYYPERATVTKFTVMEGGDIGSDTWEIDDDVFWYLEALVREAKIDAAG